MTTSYVRPLAPEPDFQTEEPRRAVLLRSSNLLSLFLQFRLQDEMRFLPADQILRGPADITNSTCAKMKSLLLGLERTALTRGAEPPLGRFGMPREPAGSPRESPLQP